MLFNNPSLFFFCFSFFPSSPGACSQATGNFRVSFPSGFLPDLHLYENPNIKKEKQIEN